MRASLGLRSGLPFQVVGGPISVRRARAPAIMAENCKNADVIQIRNLGSALATALVFVGASNPSSASDGDQAAQIVTNNATSTPASDDPVITAMFTIAVAALSVVTLGVSWQLALQ